MGRTLDRTRHELREESDVQRVIERIACRRHFAAVDIDDVADRLERVERYSDGQHDPQHGQVCVEPERLQELRKLGDEETEILERREK